MINCCVHDANIVAHWHAFTSRRSWSEAVLTDRANHLGVYLLGLFRRDTEDFQITYGQ